MIKLFAMVHFIPQGGHCLFFSLLINFTLFYQTDNTKKFRQSKHHIICLRIIQIKSIAIFWLVQEEKCGKLVNTKPKIYSVSTAYFVDDDDLMCSLTLPRRGYCP